MRGARQRWQAGAVSDMEAKIESLVNDPARRLVMGRDGRAHVMRRFGLDRLLDDVDTLYRSLLDLA